MSSLQDGVSAGVEVLVAEARRLGLVWRLIPATVVVASGNPNDITIVFDGDDQNARAQSLIGNLPETQRVMVLTIPPQGNYVIGLLGLSFEQQFLAVNANAAIGSDATVGAGYSQLGGSAHEAAFTKHFTFTRVRVDLSMSAFSSAVSTAMRVGFQLLGGTNPAIDVVNFFFNVANAHASASGHAIMTNIPAGTYTARPLWLRSSGAGTLTTDANDDLSYTVQEIW